MRRYRDIVLACILIGPIPGGTATATDRYNVEPMVSQNDEALLDDYFAEVRQTGMILAQTPDPSRRPPSIDLEGSEATEAVAVANKSPLKAFVLSAAVPGAGQLYTGSKIKAAAFFGIEVLAWAGYIAYQGKGDDKTDIYEAFSNLHWSENRYADFLDANFPLDDPSQPGPRDDDSAYDNGNLYFTHHLPDTKTQQYYEMTGKYDQFVFGWDDVDTTATPPTLANLHLADSPNRHHYEGLRHDANVMYGRATASLVVMMANHLISGAEAALAARNHNRKLAMGGQRLSVRAKTARIENSFFPMLTITYTF